jgi:hypothetical protein
MRDVEAVITNLGFLADKGAMMSLFLGDKEPAPSRCSSALAN